MSNEHVHPTFKEILHTASGIANKAMPTESDLQERIDALEAEIAALREPMAAHDAAIRAEVFDQFADIALSVYGIEAGMHTPASLLQAVRERAGRIVALGQCRANSELHEMRVECIDWKWVKNAPIADGVQQRVDEAVLVAAAKARLEAASLIESCVFKICPGDGKALHEIELHQKVYTDELDRARSRVQGKPLDCTCTKLKASADHPAGRVTRSTCPIHGQGKPVTPTEPSAEGSKG